MEFKFVVALLCATLLYQVSCEDETNDRNVDKSDSDINRDDEILYTSPVVDVDHFYFIDNFDNAEESEQKWILSSAKKDDASEDISKYDGEWKFEAPQRIVWKNDIGLVLKSKAKHAAISAPLRKIFKFENKPLIVQYEVTMQNGQDCGGSYLKLLSSSPTGSDLKSFNDKTPYTIMFGPDKCGNDIKLHFIFNHVNPINGSVTEKHCRKPKDRLDEPFKDKLPHLYQLILNPDNTFKISVDHNVAIEGSLLTDFNPAVNPPKEIDDPADIKPIDWDEREKISDPNAYKPQDWDEDAPPKIPDPSATKPNGWLESEPEMIPDANAIKPHDWDAEIDGEWEAPLIDNPICEKAVGCGEWSAPLVTNTDYKGKWNPPQIENPNYQGKWTPKKIPNPDFFEDLNPFQMTSIAGVGIELWSISNDILFDNIIITENIDVARDYAAQTFDLKRRYIEKESKTLWHRILRRMNYKPGWWALYFLYISIPLSCYAYYLSRRMKEETFLNKVVRLSNENPWLWGLYIVLIGTPLSFAVYTIFCANKEKQENDSQDKKDDDVVTVDDDINTSSTKNNDDISLNQRSGTKKEDLDIITPIDTNDKETISESTNDENVVHQETDSHSNTDGTRKRKPRKE